MLKLKDIYNLGTCLLELMIGRTNQNKYDISLDSVPLIWADSNAAAPLIQVLSECI